MTRSEINIFLWNDLAPKMGGSERKTIVHLCEGVTLFFQQREAAEKLVSFLQEMLNNWEETPALPKEIEDDEIPF